MAFDPSKPFTVISKPAFDPRKPFTTVPAGAKSAPALTPFQKWQQQANAAPVPRLSTGQLQQQVQTIAGPRKSWVPTAPRKPLKDAVVSGAMGPMRGLMGTADAFDNLNVPMHLLNLAGDTADAVVGLGQAVFNPTAPRIKPADDSMLTTPTLPRGGVTPRLVEDAVTKATGIDSLYAPVKDFAPQTKAGQYADTLGQFSVGLLAPGAMVPKFGAVLGGTLGYQGGGDALRAAGVPEPFAQVGSMLLGGAGAYAGGGGAEPVYGQAPRKPLTPQQRLLSEGVRLTPGERAGGALRSIEDKAMSAPILGEAIAGARRRGQASLVTALGNRALGEIGETIPPTVKPGNDTTGYVADRIGETYKKADFLVQAVQPDQAFFDNLNAIRADAADLPPDMQKTFDAILNNRLLAQTDKPLDGAAAKDIQSQLSQKAADYSGSSDGAQRALGRLLAESGSALRDLISRQNPEAGDLYQQADAAWANYVRLRDATASAKDGGVPTPYQIKSAVKRGDKSVGKGDYAKGQALLYDLADDATNVMSPRVPDSGTAGRVGLGALGTTMLLKPEIGIPAAAGLGVASIPYTPFVENMVIRQAIKQKALASAPRKQITGVRFNDPLSVIGARTLPPRRQDR